ncbi:unnamed protein product, partial [Mesorhabditis belari]|uniref:Fungal lipase-type domain-containing protein n=1 Tax=Mesorhabditis belari TaxID=2138241 RepID=A0AAF3FRN0_9BILA
MFPLAAAATPPNPVPCLRMGLPDGKLIFPGGGMVAEFFYSAFLGIWNGGMKDDFLSLRNSYPDYQIWVTGHSLGGAMAGLCAGYITQVGYVPLTQIRLITFGEPRTGDAKYASLIDQIPYAYRVVHDNDWVPHVPLVPMGYEHHGTQIFYPNLMKPGDPYTVCQGNEDSKCSNSVPADRLNGEAHGWYYNIDINNYESRNCVYNN